MANVVNQPDGSSASPKNPADPSPVLWEIVYEVDWTAQDAYVFTGNDNTRLVEGETWTAKSMTDGASTYCDGIEIDATGLTIKFAIGNDDSTLHVGTVTAPRIQIPVSDIVSSLSINDTIAFQCLGTAGLDDSWQQYGLFLSDGTTGVKWVENSAAYDSTAWPSPYKGTDVQLGDGGRYLEASSDEPPFRELVWYVGSAGFVAGVDPATDFIDPLTSSELEISGVVSSATSTTPGTNPTLDITKGNGTIALHGYYDDAVGGTVSHAFTVTYTKFRVLRRKT